MKEELLVRIADQTEWVNAGRWKEGPRTGELYIEDSEGISRIDDLEQLAAAVIEEVAKYLDDRALDKHRSPMERAIIQTCATWARDHTREEF